MTLPTGVTLPTGAAPDDRAWRTPHGVTLQFPTLNRPYFRHIYYTPEGQRKQPSAGKHGDMAWKSALDIDAELAAAVADPTGRLVEELLDAWLAVAKKEYGESHYDKYVAMTRRFIRPALGQLPAWPLSKDQVKAVADTPTAASAKRHTRNALGAMIVWGHENDWIESPYGVFFPRRARTAKKDAGRRHGEKVQYIDPKLRPSPAACKALAEAMRAIGGEEHGEMLWLMVAAAASCGVRQGELFAATRDRLNFATGEWLVDRQVIRVKAKDADEDDEGEDAAEDAVASDDAPAGTVRITPPKWGRIRTTIVPETTIWGEPFRAPLQAWAKTRPADGLLFPARRGGFLHPSNVRRDWTKVAREKAAPAWDTAWSWHSLRHAFCTDLLHRGARDTDVADLAGHRDSGVTRAMYVGATAGTTGRVNALLRPSGDDEQGAA